MGVFNSTQQFNLPKDRIADVAQTLIEVMRSQDYDVEGQPLLDGAWDISITKGGMFKAVLGLKTALKVSLEPRGNDRMIAEASVGIFGQQALPTVLTVFVAWPVLITQIWGLIRQSKLDDTIMQLIADAIQQHCPEAAASGEPKHCAKCGHAVAEGAKFCTECGEQL